MVEILLYVVPDDIESLKNVSKNPKVKGVTFTELINP